MFLHIGNNQTVKKNEILVILPSDAKKNEKAVILLADGRAVPSPISAATLYKRLQATKL